MSPLALAPVARDDDAPAHSAAVGRWIGFELAGQLYGVPILAVQEVLADADIEPVPGAPHGVLGVINLRGAIVTVADLRLLLGLAPAAESRGALIVFDAGTEAVAARVDRVTQVRQIPDLAIKPAPRAGLALSRSVTGVVVRDGELMTLLDAAALF